MNKKDNKKLNGFTLIELVTVIAIIGLLSAISIVSYNAVMDTLDEKYYKTLENNLLLAGNDYFNTNRGEKPIDAYSVADMNTLIDNKYIDELKKRTGETCENGSVYIVKTDNGNYEYEACITCGSYQSTGKYCNGNVPDVISIRATIDGKIYNPLLSYEKVPWAKNDVNVTFSMTNNVDTYKITNVNNNNVIMCSASSNNCTKAINESGTYKVGGYLNDVLVGKEKIFSIKKDKIAPTFNIDETNSFTITRGNTLYNYTNTITNLVEENLDSIRYSLVRTGDPDNYKTLISDVQISESVGVGLYTLKVKVSDKAGNETIKTIDMNVISDTPITLLCSVSMTEGTLTGTLTNPGDAVGEVNYEWKNGEEVVSTEQTALSIENPYIFTLSVTDRNNNTGSCSFSCGEATTTSETSSYACHSVGDKTWSSASWCSDKYYGVKIRECGANYGGTKRVKSACIFSTSEQAKQKTSEPAACLYGYQGFIYESYATACTVLYSYSRTCGPV